ncbi:MAG: hypothetical protein ACRECW_12190 [Phyllobacterium sp.]
MKNMQLHGHPATNAKQPVFDTEDARQRYEQVRDALNRRLEEQKGKGINWELLKLEFQRDFALLANEFDVWFRYLDKTYQHTDHDRSNETT